MANKYVVPDRILKIRAVVNLVAVTSGLYLFVIDSIVLSGLIEALFGVVPEKDYKITRKLVAGGCWKRNTPEAEPGVCFTASFMDLRR